MIQQSKAKVSQKELTPNVHMTRSTKVVLNTKGSYILVGKEMKSGRISAYFIVGKNNTTQRVTRQPFINMVRSGKIINVKISGQNLIGLGIRLSQIGEMDVKTGRIYNGIPREQILNMVIQQMKSSTYQMVGRILSGKEVVGYVLVDEAGNRKNISKNETIKLAREKRLQNITSQQYNGNTILRGTNGLDISSLPTINIDRKKSTEMAQQNPDTAQQDTQSTQNTKDVYSITARIMDGRENIGYMFTGVNGENKRISRAQAIRAIQNRLVKNVRTQQYQGRTIIRGINGLDISKLPTVDINGNPASITRERDAMEREQKSHEQKENNLEKIQSGIAAWKNTAEQLELYITKIEKTKSVYMPQGITRENVTETLFEEYRQSESELRQVKSKLHGEIKNSILEDGDTQENLGSLNKVQTVIKRHQKVSLGSIVTSYCTERIDEFNANMHELAQQTLGDKEANEVYKIIKDICTRLRSSTLQTAKITNLTFSDTSNLIRELDRSLEKQGAEIGKIIQEELGNRKQLIEREVVAIGKRATTALELLTSGYNALLQLANDIDITPPQSTSINHQSVQRKLSEIQSKCNNLQNLTEKERQEAKKYIQRMLSSISNDSNEIARDMYTHIIKRIVSIGELELQSTLTDIAKCETDTHRIPKIIREFSLNSINKLTSSNTLMSIGIETAANFVYQQAYPILESEKENAIAIMLNTQSKQNKPDNHTKDVIRAQDILQHIDHKQIELVENIRHWWSTMMVGEAAINNITNSANQLIETFRQNSIYRMEQGEQVTKSSVNSFISGLSTRMNPGYQRGRISLKDCKLAAEEFTNEYISNKNK